MARPSITSITSNIDFYIFNRPFRFGKGGYKTPLYQNTYRLNATNPYNQEEADKILKTTMEDTLANVKYDPQEIIELCHKITTEVQNKLLKKNYDRYKIIASVTIMQKDSNGACMSLEHLWDAESDKYSIYAFENNYLYAVGIVSALYYD